MELELTIAVAERVFGWRNVHEHQGELIGKRQDKLGRWRFARIPDYANDPKQAHAVEERMRQIGRFDAYAKELSRLTKAKGLPLEWATPEQRGQAALNAAEKKRRRY